MIRYREFAIQTASLAGLSLAAGCEPSIGGDWKGSALIKGYGDTFELPFSFSGTVSQSGWFGSSTREFTSYTMDIGLSIAADAASLSRALSKVYVYTYDYASEDYETYVADVERASNLAYSGRVTQVGDREFDIVMGLDSADETLVLNGETQPGADGGDAITTRSAVLQCGTDGEELHCFQGGELMIFVRE